MNTPDHSLGTRIKSERLARDWSQEDLAAKVGVRGLAVGKWERGQANPTTDNRIALAAAFGIEPDEMGVSELRAAPVDLSPVMDQLTTVLGRLEDLPLVLTRVELLQADLAVALAKIDELTHH